ncbi:efflux RND transporter periplasmic adaptor subunit [Bradyrhizobium sp.]|uniref:efflux RND transporter periplasmic adaptor subunit n=1 Tax=Bradyrhizobium sp. TaxID=376 RepID=UPI002D6F7B24|nr:efflux RND transporter periplasmic adaptor subunit [Bradyrhizobium sp.]HZR71413.1 efflux RND transporter periplasmic adaptor subunit [Bradyrhizobium sp.]
MLDSHPHHAPTESDTRPDKIAAPPSRARWIGGIALLVAIGIAVAGIIWRRQQENEVAKWTAELAIPTVATITPKQGVTGQQIALPGDIEAWFEAPIYARVSGYLKDWYFDFGAHVKKGELLAEIDAPDLDAQLAAAQAKLNSAQAQVKVREAERNFAETTYTRWRESPKGVVSEQETESKKAEFGSADARYKAAIAEANVNQSEVDRLTALEHFKRIRAPFDGIVTQRNTDVGALINAGSGVGGGTGPQLFRVADVHEMRVFVQVPQEISSNMRAGLTAEMTLPQYPDKTFKAVVSTTSEAINKTARTLLVELHADNNDNLLQPGTFAQVRFNLADTPGTLRIPTSALIFREAGAQVALLGPGDKVELRSIKLGRNLGTEFEVLAGLSPSDTVINSPPDSLSQGEQVRVSKDAAPSPAHEAEVR